jgi:hypothetical protein
MRETINQHEVGNTITYMQVANGVLLHTGFWLRLFFDLEDGCQVSQVTEQ